MICPNYPTPFLFFFSEQVPPLLYYSHIPILLVSIFIGIFVVVKDRNSLLSWSLAIPLFLFSIWTIFDLITWTSNSSDNIMFVWSFFGILFIAINFFFLRFLYIFIDNKKEIPLHLTILTFILSLPVIILTPTSFNLPNFDMVLCSAIEGNYFLNYYYLVGVLIFLYICFFVIKLYLSKDTLNKTKTLFMGVGTISFLFFFFVTGFLGSFLKFLGITKDYQIEQYGYFPVIIFIILLALTVIKYKIFNIKLLAVRALVFGLVFLIGSQFFFIKTPVNFILNGVTFIGVIIFGVILVKYVKKEVEQKENLEKLRLRLEESNLRLGIANDKLKDLDKLKTEFVSLASHQLRSPLTAIKGYTSMLLEGDYGEINPEVKEKIERVMESSNNLTLVVEDLLNVSKIEQGGMKYEMVKFDFGNLVDKTATDLSITAEKKGLKLTCKVAKNRKYYIKGDEEKLRQVIVNLIDNSMKYTPKGEIEISLKKEQDKILLLVKDTGVGIPKDVIGKLFEKFSRGEGAKLNSSGSGLGLYLVKEIVEAHKGRVWVESEGKDKGATFFVEIAEAI